MNYRWHLWILAFFASGLLMGAGFVVAGPVAVVRILGTLAMACSAVGAGIALWTLRADDPWQWALYRFRIARFFDAVVDSWSRLRADSPVAHHHAA